VTQVRPLPRSLDPLPDESLPGYLLRLAHRLDLTPQRVAELTGLAKPGGAAPAEHMLDLDETTLDAFARATRLTTREVGSLLLLGLAERYPLDRNNLIGQPRQLRGIMQQDSWLLTNSTRSCPDCLTGDDSIIQQRHGGPWRRHWRLPVVFACAQHRRLLEHRCPACRFGRRSAQSPSNTRAPASRNELPGRAPGCRLR